MTVCNWVCYNTHMEKDGEQFFRDIERAAEEKYKSVGAVQCPYFNEAVHFGNAGFLHLLYKHERRPRLLKDKLRRFALIDKAISVLKISKTLQEYVVTKEFVRTSVNSRIENRLLEMRYYAFIAIIDLSHRIKVVVREIEGGKKHFYSA